MIRTALLRMLLPALATAALHAPASAGCSRPITVPAAAIGHVVTFSADGVAGGVIPEQLALIGERIGCTFVWSQAPRVRIEAMFESGAADLLVAANQVERRDRHGIFIPIVETRPSLISLAGKHETIRTVEELLRRQELRVALVRGYEYGDAYQAMIKKLAQQGRVFTESSPANVARRINEGMADVTIMPAHTFSAALEGDPRTENMAGKVRMEALGELQWIRSGIYLSRKSLNAADRKLIADALAASARTSVWWEALKRLYPPAELDPHVRPLPAQAGRATAR